MADDQHINSADNSAGGRPNNTFLPKEEVYQVLVMQRKKNIKLTFILAGMIIITVATYFLLQREDNYKVSNSGLFAMDDVSKIDSVSLVEDNSIINLYYNNNEWLINNKYKADPGKLTVLFAILNQVRAKRPVARAEQEMVDSLFQRAGTEVQFFEKGELVKKFSVAGLETKGLTYFRNNEEAYLVTIPGYRSYLAAIFQMNISDWRDKLIFDEVSWNNLEKVEITYPSNNSKGFKIKAHKNYFNVQGVAATDSVKLLNYIDAISVLMADEYVKEQMVPDTLIQVEPLVGIAITDIRNRPFTLTIYPAGNEGYHHIALKDSSDWLKLSTQKVDPLIKGRQYFSENNGNAE